MTRIVVRLLLVALAFLPLEARAQFGFFGQNKIQYRDFDWRVLSGAHVDVYYYPAEERIARMALSYAEDSYDHLEGRFNHRIEQRIPLIVYASHSDFEQTNVLPFVPPEGVLGVTEFLKRRVAVPFRGSYSEFRHTLRHELVHVFQLSLAARNFALYPRARRAGTPLWWSEGLAEYFSSEQETRDEMVVRDVTVHGIMPTISQLNLVGSAIVYPIGGDLHRFLGAKYGDWRVNLLYESLWKAESFDDALRLTYGRTAEQLTEEWHHDLRRRYYPSVPERRPPQLQGRRIADLAVKPVAIEQDTGVAVGYLSPRSGYTNIYAEPLDGGRARVIVHGQRTPEFESFHEFSSRMDSRDGVLLFASKYGDRDAIFFWDIEKERVVGRYQFDSLVSIMSPAWAPDGRRVAFSAMTDGGISDLWLLDTRSGALSRVTDDPYEDLDPTWLPSGRIVFSSDRAPGGADHGSRNLFVVAAEGGAVRAITHGRWIDETPRWDPEGGRIVFSSDRDGSFAVYTVDTLGNGRKQQGIEGAIFDPTPVPGDDRIVATAFSRLSWSIYGLRTDSADAGPSFSLAPRDTGGDWRWKELDDHRVATVSSQRYRRDFSLDFAAGGGQVGGAGYYNQQGAVVYFSDLLGDHVLVTSLALFGNTGLDDFLQDLNVDVFYLNQKRRLNWGLGAFRLAGTFEERVAGRLYDERSTGAYAAVRYPFSRFTRVEAQTRLEYSVREDLFGFREPGSARGRREGVLTSNFVSFVGDNSLWLETGPIDGMRFNLTGGVVSDVTHGAFENWTGIADLRRYLRTSQQSALALRTFGYISEGTRPRPIALGGSWLLRGYPYFSETGTRAWVASEEWRFPITNFVTVGFPFGPIRFPQVQGAFFNDNAQAWSEGAWDERIRGSAGVGFRMALIPGLVLRLDVGRRYSLNAPADDPLADEYSARFADFFFGYNY